MENVEITSGEVVSESIESEDPWQAAEEAFDSLGDESKEEKVEQKVESHIEQKPEDVPDYLKLDDLKVPHKYKDEVKARIQKVVSDYETKKKSEIEAVSKELGQSKEAITSLVKVFQDIAKTPKEQLSHRVADYIEKYGQDLGLDPSSAQSLRAEKEIQKQEAKQAQTLQDITDKYAEKMAHAQDAQEFVSLMKQSDLEKSQVLESQLLNKFGMMLKAYHDQVVEPDKKFLEEYKTKSQKDAEVAELNTRKSAWTSASQELVKKYSDFDKYKPKILEVIKDDKGLQAAFGAVNEDLSDVESRQKLMEKIYLSVSRDDAIASLKQPRSGGLPPSQKHVQTRKPNSGGDFDAVWENQKHLWE